MKKKYFALFFSLFTAAAFSLNNCRLNAATEEARTVNTEQTFKGKKHKNSTSNKSNSNNKSGNKSNANQYNSSKTSGSTQSGKPTATKTDTSVAKSVADDKLLMQKGFDGQLLRRFAYTAMYDKNMRLPRWVAWHLTGSHTTGSYKRNGINFEEDMDVPAPRAVNLDYVNSGYDRGHMCPSGDNKWNQTAQQQSFLYTNCCPQLHSLNAGDWEELESKCREWAKKYGDIYIVCGPVFLNKKHKTIGKNKVVVPEAFFKVVLCMRGTPKAIGFIYRNDHSNKAMSSYVNSVDEVERITGFDFFPALDDRIEKKVEAHADLSQW